MSAVLPLTCLRIPHSKGLAPGDSWALYETLESVLEVALATHGLHRTRREDERERGLFRAIETEIVAHAQTRFDNSG